MKRFLQVSSKNSISYFEESELFDNLEKLWDEANGIENKTIYKKVMIEDEDSFDNYEIKDVIFTIKAMAFEYVSEDFYNYVKVFIDRECIDLSSNFYSVDDLE